MSTHQFPGATPPSSPAEAVAAVEAKSKTRPYVVLRKDGERWEELKKTFTASKPEQAIEQAGEYLAATSDGALDEVLVAVSKKNFTPRPVKEEVVTSLKIG